MANAHARQDPRVLDFSLRCFPGRGLLSPGRSARNAAVADAMPPGMTGVWRTPAAYSWHARCVSYDLAFWDGPAPADDANATDTFNRLSEALENGGVGAAPTASVLGLVGDLEARWPDDHEDLPWASWPIRGHAHGPLLYLNLRYGRPADELEFIVAAARARGLVCYDPQFSQVL